MRFFTNRVTTLVLCIVIVYSVSSCIVTENPSSEFLSLLNASAPQQSPNLRFDGFYQAVYEEHDYHHGFNYKDGVPTQYIDTPYAVGPISFFKNGMIMHENVYFRDSVTYKSSQMNYPRYAKGIRYWGVYTTKNDTIRGILYMSYTGRNTFKRRQYKQAYFEGILQIDKISRWHLVPPYPDIDDQLNDFMLKNDKIPRDLFFKPNPLKALINPDSTAWINEFKNMELIRRRRKK